MDAERDYQLSALLACQSRADLTRIEKINHRSLIALACKHNRADLLHFLLEDETSSALDGAVSVTPRWCSVNQQFEGHNAMYYAIRSSNVELLCTLLGPITPELSERLVSESYEKLLFNNVLVSEEMHLFVQYKLHGLRFFSKNDEALPAISTANIQERIQLLVENIAQVNTCTKVDSHFLYIAKFIAQNIHILKHQLKSTYNILPWEEIEFCLVCFVSAHIRRQELNLFFLSVLKRERLLQELDMFSSALQELKEHIGSADVRKLQKKVDCDREDIAAVISRRYPHLYADYEELRDVSSLHIMKTYLDAALLADSATRFGQLTIKRALQVTGEHLKNTLDSPKLSPTLSELIILSAPKETRKVLKDLRNSLSHPHLECEKSILYSNIQNDIKKIVSVINDIKYSNKVKKIKCMLTTLKNSDNVDEFHEVANIFRNVCIADVQETDTVTKDHQELVDLLRNVEDKTPYEKKLFAEIKDVLLTSKIQHNLTREDHSYLKTIVSISSIFHGTKAVDYMIKAKKIEAKRALANFPIHENSSDERCFLLGSLLSKFYVSALSRIKPEIAVQMIYAIDRIHYTGSIDKGNIKCIDEYSRQFQQNNKKKLISSNKFNKSDNDGQEKCKIVKNSSEIINNRKQLFFMLAELENILGTDKICGQLYEHLSILYKDETTNRFTVECLVLDTMSLLDSSKCVLNNVMYLDGDMPLLNGRCLRNHLAHRNALVDILPTDAWSAVLLNAVKLTESKDLLMNHKIGNILKHNIKQLRRRYEQGLFILNKQKEMWKSLLEGNFEKFTSVIEGGADICSRREDLSSTLHYAARGPNIEIIKFLTRQKIINTEWRDIDGQTALHVAATFGKDVTVKFLLAEMGNAINQVDDAGMTPLHLASQNGHTETVVTLLSLGAKTSIKGNSGNSPLFYAVVNNYLDVVKILLGKDATVDENTDIGGYTSLHTAAEFGRVEMVQYLLLHEADVNAKTILGTLPLHLAAFNGHQEVVNVLLEKGAHVNLRDSNGNSPLHFAVEINHEEIVKILVKKGAFINNGDVPYNNTPFHTAALKGNAFIVGLLLQHNANVNAKRHDDRTPLLQAAEGGHADVIDLLLQNGALADSREVTGLTALHIAALFGHTSVVETLIQRGIDVLIQNSCQETPLHLAAQAGHQQVVDILLAAGTNIIHSVNNKALTALHLSARNGHEAISESLIKKGAEVNCKDSTNLTPLHIAACKPYNHETIQILLKYGANVEEKGEFGYTALHFASFSGESLIVEALLKGKAEVDAEVNGGETALLMAVSGNHKATVEILLKYGANVNHLDSTNSSALCFAAKNNNKDLLDILIAKGADVNVGGGQLLLTAIAAGHRLVVEALLKNKDIDINIKDRDGTNLLYTAAVTGDPLIARALIKKGIKVAGCIHNPSPLFNAISYGHTDFAEVLLENGADVNSADPNLSPLFHAILMNKPDIMERLLHWGSNPNIKDSKNRTPLELAVGNAQMSNTLILLQQEGVRINQRGPDNWTLLHDAAQAGNLEITKLLVDRGADINARNKLDYKPIHIAAMHGNHNILSFFLELGMSIHDVGYAGCSLMHCATARGHLEVAQFLIDKHVNINTTYLNGFFPIHCSAEQGDTEMVKLLLRSGVVYDATDNFGRTPSVLTNSRDIGEVLDKIGLLFKAVKENNFSTVEILIEDLSQYVNVRNSENLTLLHIASQNGFQEVCDILLKSKANPNAVGNEGNTPLHYASKYSHPGIVESLLKNGAAHNVKADNMKTPLDFATQKDVQYLLQIVALCFRKVRTRDVEVIRDIAKMRDVEFIKAVMKARDADGNTLVVIAMKNDFPDTVQLTQVSQANVTDILIKVDSLFTLERFTEAIEILNQLLNDRIEILGEDNPGTLDIQYNIMRALFKQSKYFEAMPMCEDIYRKRVEAFGPHHPVSLETRSIMALLLNKLGRNKESWDIFQEVMPRQREVLGEGHEILLQTKTNAGATLKALGNIEEALCLYTQVYKIYKNTLGALHLHTLVLQDNIAGILHIQGKPHEALALYSTVYEARKKSLGVNHSATLLARRGMAFVLMTQHKLDEALQVFQETLAIQMNVLGLDHEDTLRTQSLISCLYLRQHKAPDALRVHKAGLNGRNNIFGPNHPVFVELDEHLNNVNKYFKSRLDVDVGYVSPRDLNLLNASSMGDRSKVYSLIESGSDVNTADCEGRTALHLATTVEVIELLLDSGADATAVSQAGNTPLHLAASRACAQTVCLLLQNVKRTKPNNVYHKFINAKTAVEGSTALQIASKKGAADIVSCLLAHGACYNS